jgi:hypothetical protein
MRLVQGKNVETDKQLGRSKGGFSSKLHAACNALGNPLRFFVTAAESFRLNRIQEKGSIYCR